ncbi:MAG: DEAD/DEAH box helicase [Candidatus Kapabacteria bacterium]|nr:DEAD/DEAH box helicase [Candidatus Kapabacteria bacterium]
MAIKVDNIELDDSNEEFNMAVDLVENTSQLIYLTGKAGTGKTTFLKYIKQSTYKKAIVLAPTGVAALNAGGQTIHSFFRIAPSVYMPDDSRLRTESDPDSYDEGTIFDHFKYHKAHRKLISAMELLIIDEISMVRCDLLDVVDRLLRVFRDRESEPFGGVQVVLIGDAFQLPPIAQNEHWEFLKDYYESPFFFSSLVLKQNRVKYIELRKIYRQHDLGFINLLNNIRVNQVSQDDLNLLNSRFLPAIFKNDNLKYISIATHNRIVDDTNIRKLEELSTPLQTYEAEITGDFPDSISPTEKFLNLKEGAQIMFIKNDAEKKYFNGKIAKIKKLEKAKIIVEISEGVDIEVKRFTWKNIKYSWSLKDKKINEEAMGEFTQFPIKLAWAVTVHKCQGLTFENVIADLSGAFSPGQVYVALSRCTSIEGLVLKSRVNRNVIKTDPHVIKFAGNKG